MDELRTGIGYAVMVPEFRDMDSMEGGFVHSRLAAALGEVVEILPLSSPIHPWSFREVRAGDYV